MKQTLTINLNQIIFNIDNDAYEVLSDYLKSIEKHFEKETEGEEIINDIEARIAEKFNGILNKKKAVVNLSDVKSIIKEMGTISDITNEDDNEEQADVPKITKKLFRNPDKKIIGGVAAGLAEYFGIDTYLMRLIMLALFIPMHGLLVLAYIIMWIKVPEAKKGSDKLLMKGQPITLSNLESTATNEEENTKHSNTAYILLRVFTGIIGVSLIIGMISAIGGIVFGITQLAVNIPLVSTSIPELSFINSIPVWQLALLYISLSLIAIIPLSFILRVGITLLRHKSSLTLKRSIVLIVLWFMSLSIFTNLGCAVYFQNRSQINGFIEKAEESKLMDESFINEQKIENFNQIKIKGALNVVYKNGPENKIKIVGYQDFKNPIKFNINDGVLIIKRNNECFDFPFFGSRTKIEVYGPELQKISLSGSSNLTLENVATEKLEIEISGASKITGNGFANDFSLKSSGASSVKLFDLETDNTSIDTSGASKIEIAVNKTLNISSSGASKISYKGDPAIKQRLSGASKIERILQ